MRDTRSTEIKKLLKKNYPEAEFRVKIDKYSMGESIYVKTNLITRETVKDTEDYTGFSTRLTNESKLNRSMIQTLLRNFESVDRDESGDILGGANTFLFVGEI